MLAIYLNDHLLAATAGLELARRAHGANGEGELGELLGRLEAELDEDRETLRAVMAAVDAGEDRAKKAAGWAAEKLGRLKLNGQLFGYSPLSRVLELEGLALIVDGNAALWRMLGDLADPRLERFELGSLAERSRRRHDELERHRLAAGREAFG